MKAVKKSEMRTVSGGKHYAYCPVCGRKQEVKWTLHVLFVGWKRAIAETEESMNWDHWVNGHNC